MISLCLETPGILGDLGALLPRPNLLCIMCLINSTRYFLQKKNPFISKNKPLIAFLTLMSRLLL